MLNDVKSLYDLGGAIILLHARSKRPVGNAWQTGPRALWSYLEKNYRDHNLGIRLGEPSRLSDGTYLIALDCDVKSGDPAHIIEMEKLLAAYHPMILNAPYVISGRGGGSRHYYIRVKDLPVSGRIGESKHKTKVKMPSVKAGQAERDALSSSEIAEGWRIRNAWEVDLFATGKQVALPPSIHPDTKKEYRWGVEIKCLDDIPLVELGEAPKSLRVVNYNVKIDDTVDLFTLRLSPRMFELITSMKGLDHEPYHGDRSRAVNAAIWALIQCNLSDVQIASILTDANYDLSECALDRGKGDRRAAVKWLMPQIQKARIERVASDFRDEFVEPDVLTPEEAKVQTQTLTDWTENIQRNASNNNIKATSFNCILFLKHLPVRNVFGYNDLAERVDYVSEPPWRKLGSRHSNTLQDVDFTEIGRWMQNVSPKLSIPEFTEDKIAKAIELVAKENHFHPIKTYLKSLEWDGISRVDTWLKTYLSAEGPEKYVRAIGRKVLLAAVRRVMRPGHKFDYMLVLEGTQGIGKSQAIRVLASDDWFTDSLTTIDKNAAIEAMQGKWLIEMSELSSMSKADVEHFKMFLTSDVPKARMAYGRKPQEFPRQCIFIGTTNKSEYLKDSSGNRRFWPVKCGAVDLELLKKDRDQIWAEAYELNKANEPLWLDDQETAEQALQSQSKRMVGDDWENLIVRYFERLDSSDGIDPNLELDEWFSTIDIYNKAIVGMGNRTNNLPKHEQMRIAEILKNIGCKSGLPRIGGHQIRAWKRGSIFD